MFLKYGAGEYMTALIINTTVVTCDAGRRVHYGAALAVEGERIVEVGPSAELEARYPGRSVLTGGKVVFPGLVNCHTHLLATADRGILEDFGVSDDAEVSDDWSRAAG